MNNVVTTLASSFFIGSSSFLQATSTPIISQKCWKFSRIRRGTYELPALEHLEKSLSSILKEPFALKNSETIYFTSIFSTLRYSDTALINNFDLIFFNFYFVFEIFGNDSILTP